MSKLLVLLKDTNITMNYKEIPIGSIINKTGRHTHLFWILSSPLLWQSEGFGSVIPGFERHLVFSVPYSYSDLMRCQFNQELFGDIEFYSLRPTHPQLVSFSPRLQHLVRTHSTWFHYYMVMYSVSKNDNRITLLLKVWSMILFI